MADIVAKAIDAGAIGFSTNRFAPHKAPDGRSIPGTFADASELVEIGKAVAARNGLMQAVGATGDVLKAIADQSGSRVLFSYGVGADKGAGTQIRGRSRQAVRGPRPDRDQPGQGHRASCSDCSAACRSAARPGRRCARSTWPAVSRRSRIPQTAAKLIAEGETRLPLEHTYYIGDERDAEPDRRPQRKRQGPGWRRAAKASSRCSCACRARRTVARSSTSACSAPTWTSSAISSQHTRHVLPSLGDAGAHVSQIIDADWATFTLKYWVKERRVYSAQRRHPAA